MFDLVYNERGTRVQIDRSRDELLTNFGKETLSDRYLPPHSPDLNPIEMAFAKLKAWLRHAAVRSIDDLWKRIGKIIDTFTPQECVNFFRVRPKSS